MSGPFIIVSVLMLPPFFVKVLWQKRGTISTSAKIKFITHFEGCFEARVKTLKTLLLLVLFFGHVLKHFLKKQKQKQHGTKLQKQHTASRKSGFWVGPQHQRGVFVWIRNNKYWSVGMQAVQWCGVHSSAGDLSSNKKGHGFKQNGVYL